MSQSSASTPTDANLSLGVPPKLPPFLPKEVLDAAEEHKRLHKTQSNPLHRALPRRGSLISAKGVRKEELREENLARIALWAFQLVDTEGRGEVTPAEVIVLVPKAKLLEPFSQHIGDMMLKVPSSAEETPVYVITKAAFLRHAVASDDFMHMLKERMEIELSPAKKSVHAEWLQKQKENAVESTVMIQERVDLKKNKAAKVAPLTPVQAFAKDVEAGETEHINAPEEEKVKEVQATAFGLYTASAPDAKGCTVANSVFKTFLLLFIPAMCILTGLIFAARAAGRKGVCSNTCDCSSDILGQLTRHILVKRMPFDIFLHAFTAHLFSSIIRIGDSWLNVDLVIPLVSSVTGEIVCLYCMHILFDGISHDVEMLVSLCCIVIPTLCFAVYRKALKRGLFAVSPLLFVIAVLMLIWGLKEIVLTEFSADAVLTAWPVVVFVVTQVWVVALNLLIKSIQGKITFNLGVDGTMLPDRQLLHVAVALDVFSDAVRSLLVMTITSETSLLINLALTVVIEAVTRNNLHKWVLARILSPCTSWTPKPTRLEELMNASQLYAGYMPFTGLCTMYIAGYFPWGVSFVECVTGELDLPGSYVTVVWLFVAELLCTVSSLLVHTKLKCILPKDVRETGQLSPLIALKGVVPCGLLSLALCSFVLYGFAGSGDIAMSASRELSGSEGVLPGL